MRQLTPRTKAIIPVQLAGNACRMDTILEIAQQYGLYVVEDCAQSYNTQYRGQKVGTFADKAWPRQANDPNRRSHQFVTPNYRVTEMQAAVALASLGKLDWICDQRTSLGDLLTSLIAEAPGVWPMVPPPGGVCTYWFYAFRVGADIRGDFACALNSEGIPAMAGYIDRPMYLFDVLVEKQTFGTSRFPFGYAPFRPPEECEIEYREGCAR